MAITVKKVSVAVGTRELEWAKREAKRTKQSLSAVLTEALRRHARMRARDVYIATWSSVPKLTPAELEDFRREWQA